MHKTMPSKGGYARYSHGRSPNQNLASLLEEYTDDNPEAGRAVGLIFSVPRHLSDAMQAYSLLMPDRVRGKGQVKAALSRYGHYQVFK